MFKIGDTVWVPDCGNEQVAVPCPVCFGKMKVTLILGNGDMVELPCEGCGWGFEGPRGYVMEYRPHTGATMRIIAGVRTRLTNDGSEVEYLTTDHYCLKPEACFATKEEAEQASEAKRTALEKEQIEKPRYDRNKTYAWNVRYHMGRARQAERDLAYHSKMAVLCKERAKA